MKTQFALKAGSEVVWERDGSVEGIPRSGEKVILPKDSTIYTVDDIIWDYDENIICVYLFILIRSSKKRESV